MEFYFLKKLFLILFIFGLIPFSIMALKPGDILSNGTYFVKNVCSDAYSKDHRVTYWIYDSKIIWEKKEEKLFVAGKIHPHYTSYVANSKEVPFDAVFVQIKENKAQRPLFIINDGNVQSNFEYFHAFPEYHALPRGVFRWKSDSILTEEGGRGLDNSARLGCENVLFGPTGKPYQDGGTFDFDQYNISPADITNNSVKSGVVKIDTSKYPRHPFNFKVRKLDETGGEVGPEYLVDFNKPKPEIISVIGAVEQHGTGAEHKPKPDSKVDPKSQPEKHDFQAKLGQLKNSLVDLKGKLGSLSGKLIALKGKLGGAVDVQGKTGGAKGTVGGTEGTQGKTGAKGDGKFSKASKFTGAKTGTEGTLQFVNLAYLIQESAGYQKRLSTPVFNIIVFNSGEANKFKKFADVSQVMANKLNNNAVFQFASNDDPTWTSGLGQAAAVLPATQEAAQRRHDRMDLEPLQKKSLNTTGENPANIDNIWIGIHSNIRVEDVSDPHKINLILVAARSGAYKNPHTENCQKVAYDGTLLAAAKLSAPKVFLTFMGGAIFAAANPRDKIIEALTNAVNSYVIDFGLNVTLVYWSDRIPTDLLPLTRKIGGYVCFFENANKATYKNYPGNNQIGGAVENIASMSDDEISRKLFGLAK